MPTLRTNRGKIGYTNKYKCLGDDQTGRNISKIEKKMEKIKYITGEVRRYGSYREVGKADTQARIFLMETLIEQALLFNTETWVNGVVGAVWCGKRCF